MPGSTYATGKKLSTIVNYEARQIKGRACSAIEEHVPLLLGQPWNLEDRPNLDRSDRGHRDPFRDSHRIVEILCFDQVVAPELLPRFGERTIGHESFSFTYPDAGRSRRRVQRTGGEIMSTGGKILRELSRFHVAIHPLGRG